MAHIVRVARLGGRLAYAHGIDPDAARTAGLLHDLARLFPAERLLAESERRGLPVGPFERANPVVLHAALGAELAREEFGVSDPAVLSAIRKHTVADAVMSPLDRSSTLPTGSSPDVTSPAGRNSPGSPFVTSTARCAACSPRRYSTWRSEV